MNISEALIEKYHQGRCSPEETEAVERWLENGDEPDLDFPDELVREDIRMEIWQGLHSKVARDRQKTNRRYFWKQASRAAAAVLLVFSVLFYFVKNRDAGISEGNKLAQTEKQTSSAPLQIEYGRESGAVYSKEKRTLNFCGVIKITPRQNMKLSFTSVCDGKEEIVKEVDVKGGATYFAMDLKDENTSQLVVMDQNLIAELPPLLQNSLIAQFGI